MHLLTLSARTEDALRERALQLAEHLTRDPDISLADVCTTANAGRSHLAIGLVHLIRDPEITAPHSKPSRRSGRRLRSPRERWERRLRRSLFYSRARAAQYAGMAGVNFLTPTPLFDGSLSRCADILHPHLERPLLEVLFAAEKASSPLSQTAYAQPALFAVGYSLAALWQSWGVRPAAVLGHSLGEYTAACVAGVMSLEDALLLVATRALRLHASRAGGRRHGPRCWQMKRASQRRFVRMAAGWELPHLTDRITPLYLGISTP